MLERRFPRAGIVARASSAARGRKVRARVPRLSSLSLRLHAAAVASAFCSVTHSARVCSVSLTSAVTADPLFGDDLE